MPHDHVAYDPAKLDFVRDADGKPVVTSDMPPPRHLHAHWMQVTDSDDTREFAGYVDGIHERYDPEIVLQEPGSAVRLWKLRKRDAR
jgi:hypothetical protein